MSRAARKSAANTATTAEDAASSSPAAVLPSPKARLVTEEYELPIKRCGYYGASSASVRLTVHYKDEQIEKLVVDDGNYTFTNRDETIQTCQIILALAQRMPPKKEPRDRTAKKKTKKKTKATTRRRG